MYELFGFPDFANEHKLTCQLQSPTDDRRGILIRGSGITLNQVAKLANAMLAFPCVQPPYLGLSNVTEDVRWHNGIVEEEKRSHSPVEEIRSALSEWS